MLTIAPIPEQRSIARLDLSSENSGVFTPGIESIEFTQAQLRRFNTVAQSLNPQMQALTSDQVAGVARRVLRTHLAGGESPFIRSRMRRAAELRAMRADSSWTCTAEVTRRLDELISYMDDPESLFRDDIPVIGLLDNALLVDIALDDLREELNEYADYRRHLGNEAARLGVPLAALQLTREQWEREREDEVRLERQLRRVHGTRYAGGGPMDRLFRVC